MMKDLETLIDLSHEFGTPDYVKGGGGNTSFKIDTTMWIKPSGTTLSGLSVGRLVAMNRGKIDALYEVETPAESADREELVKNLMAEAVENNGGRPSVEAPLHNVFEAAFVVHTHAVLVNGLTCAQNGKAACKRLFPDALWVEYIDPGYTLCMDVRERIGQYQKQHGHQPAVLILQNHGIFVAANTPEEIRALYAGVMETLAAEYVEKGISQTLEVAAASPLPATEEQIAAALGDDAAFIASSGMFAFSPGPITPDHLVYSKAFPYQGALTRSGVEAYRAERGYMPKFLVMEDRIYGVGTSQNNADLALELAQDGALVMQLAEAFGGIHYMTDAQREFIEQWEVEAYRQKQL